MLKSFFVLVALVAGLNANAQFLVDRTATFSKILKYEESHRGVKKADVHQGPLLKPNRPGLPEIEIYKRAIVFRRVFDLDTVDAVYTGEGAGKLKDSSPVQEGRFDWRTANNARLAVIRDSLLQSLDGTQRTFVQSKRKLKKKVVKYTYAWSDPSGFPRVFIDYDEKAKVPRSLQMRIEYTAVTQ